ncbi:MAG TPA: amidohydrolase [Candidatus Udaeobacter sp.]|jgi:predicted TIM-barrel fold metal-dependent hydrolase|nr:amidohydrolase [Candidatus Udaeobacter sp.]
MVMKIVDTHQHLWDLDLFRYAWLQQLPDLNRSFRMNDYLAATNGLAIEKSVHLEADVDEPFMLDETMHLLRLADCADNPLEGVVACGRPESKEFKTYVEKIAGHPKLRGIRRVLHTRPDDLGQSETFIENISSLAGYSLSFDICVLARQLPIAIRLVSQCPDVTFILDHCGVPQVKDKIFTPWCSLIREIAKFPNIFCKVSGLIAYADPSNWTEEDLRPYVDHAIECFGWDRVMFGSDWPVCTLSANYRQWVDVLLSLTRSAGEANQKKLFHDNAIRVYRLT